MRTRMLVAMVVASILALQIPALAAEGSVSSEEHPPLSGPPAAHRAWVVVAETSRIPAIMTDAEINAAVDVSLGFWAAQTGGLISSFDRATADPAHLEGDSGMCPALDNGMDAAALWDDAAELVDFPGGANNHLIVLIPKECQTYVPGDFGASTLGSTTSSGGRTLSILGGRTAEALIVELGHNLSLGEASTAWCWTCHGVRSDMYSPVGDLTRLSDTFDAPVLGTAQRDLLGLVPHDSPTSLVSPTSFTLTARGATSTAGLTGLRVAWGDEVYAVEYRAGQEHDRDTAYAAAGESLTGEYRFPVGVTVTKIEAATRTTAVLSTFKEGRDGVAAVDTGASWRIDPEVDKFTVAVEHRDAQTAAITLTPGNGGQVPMVVQDRRYVAAIALSGTRSVGSVMTIRLVDWPPSSVPTYEWRSGSSVIGRSASITLPASTFGRRVDVAVSGTAGLVPLSVSAGLIVTPGRLVTGAPKITGTAKVGRTLRVSPGRWTGGTTLRYRWYANSKAISGATKSSYRISNRFKGKKIRVRVTGSKFGYVSVSRFSAYTKKVARR